MEISGLHAIIVGMFVAGLITGVGIGYFYAADNSVVSTGNCSKVQVPNIVVNVEMPESAEYNFSDKEVAIYNTLSKQYDVEFVDIGWDANNFLRVYIYSRDGTAVNNSEDVFKTTYGVFQDADVYCIIKEQPDARVIMATNTQLKLRKYPKVIYYNKYAVEQIVPIRNYR